MTPESPRVLTDVLRDALSKRNDVACVLDSKLQVAYCNPAWDRFALENDGEAAIGRRVLGTCVLDVSGESLRPFYEGLFASVHASRKPFGVDYECSSPERFRKFRMEIMPLEPGGFVILHTLRVEEPHSEEVHTPDAQGYENSNGIIVMCSHCRKTRPGQDQDRWDWVPSYLSSGARNISHGLCNVCRNYYYPQFSLTRAFSG